MLVAAAGMSVPRTMVATYIQGSFLWPNVRKYHPQTSDTYYWKGVAVVNIQPKERAVHHRGSLHLPAVSDKQQHAVYVPQQLSVCATPCCSVCSASFGRGCCKPAESRASLELASRERCLHSSLHAWCSIEGQQLWARVLPSMCLPARVWLTYIQCRLGCTTRPTSAAGSSQIDASTTPIPSQLVR
jgi:hypothetical protein